MIIYRLETDHVLSLATNNRKTYANDTIIRGKAFREMKKNVGMTTAQKSKEIRRMEMGSIFVLYIQPTIPTYKYITTL